MGLGEPTLGWGELLILLFASCCPARYRKQQNHVLVLSEVLHGLLVHKSTLVSFSRIHTTSWFMEMVKRPLFHDLLGLFCRAGARRPCGRTNRRRGSKRDIYRLGMPA